MTQAHIQAMAVAAIIVALLPSAALSFHSPTTTTTTTTTSRVSSSLSPPSPYSRPTRNRLHVTLDKKDRTTFFVEGGEKEWPVDVNVNVNVSSDSFQRARLAEQLRLSSKTPPSPSDEEKDTPLALLTSRLADDILRPILDPEIERNVPPEFILGAAIDGSFLAAALLLGSSVPLFQTLVAAFSVGILAAYVSITRGKSGEALREAGRYTMVLADAAVERYREFEAGLKVERASRALETLSRVDMASEGENSTVKSVLRQADNALKEVFKAEAELEAKQKELEAAAEKRKRALAEASEMIDHVERAKSEAIRKVRDSKTRVADEEERENRPLDEEERLWLEEQNRLANERLLARLEKEEQITQVAARLQKNPVDCDAAAGLAYERSGSNDGFSTFPSEYLVNTSAMVAKKYQDRRAAAKMEAERPEGEEKEEVEAKMVAQQRMEAEERSRVEAMTRSRAEEVASAVKRDAERIMKDEEARLEEEAAAANKMVPLAEQEEAVDESEVEIDQEDWEASVRLANELAGVEGGASVRLVDELAGLEGDMKMNEIDAILQVELSDLTQDEEELLGKAAREAVRKYEEEMQMKMSGKQALESSRDEKFVITSAGQEEEQIDDTENYSEMTVAELKAILRSKGLKVGGVKSELIERLRSS